MMPIRQVSTTSRWLLQVGVAALVTVVFTSQVYVWVNLWPMTVSWWSALLWSVPQLLIWGLSIPLVLRLGRRLPLEGPIRSGRFVLHLALSVAYAFAVLLVLDLSDAVLRWSYLIGAPGSLVPQRWSRANPAPTPQLRVLGWTRRALAQTVQSSPPQRCCTQPRA